MNSVNAMRRPPVTAGLMFSTKLLTPVAAVCDRRIPISSFDHPKPALIERRYSW
ncbi:MAG: hypothetical protein U0V70_11105 [Terriglobia bacterium]